MCSYIKLITNWIKPPLLSIIDRKNIWKRETCERYQEGAINNVHNMESFAECTAWLLPQINSLGGKW